MGRPSAGVGGGEELIGSGEAGTGGSDGVELVGAWLERFRLGEWLALLNPAVVSPVRLYTECRLLGGRDRDRSSRLGLCYGIARFGCVGFRLARV